MQIIDGHCDTLGRCRETGQPLYNNELHWDITRAVGAGLIAQFTALYNDCIEPDSALAVSLEQIEVLLRAVDQQQIQIINSQEDLSNLNTVGAVLHLEGGTALGSNPDRLNTLYRLGMRSLGLTWNHRNQLADGVGVNNPEGLTAAGRCMLQRAEQLGIIIDLAHLAAPGVDEILDCYQGVVVYTHGNYHKVHPHPRNISYEQAKRLAERGGVIGLSLVPHFIAAQPSVEAWLEHLCRLCEDVGCEHVALGSDFDGYDWLVGDNINFYQQIPQLLSQAGFTPLEAEMIASSNWLNILKQALPRDKEKSVNGI